VDSAAEGAIWLLLAAVVLGGAGIWLLVRGHVLRRRSGLPQGRVVYRDTGDWERCERPLFSARYQLTGRPDYLVRQGQDIIPVEVKSGSAPPEPYVSHLLQLAAYCLLVEEVEGHAPPHGILRYADRTYEVDYSPSLRAELLQTLDRIRASLHAADVHRDHQEAARCAACGFRARCSERLA
jgi:CRISPR-associated exonuclease Cas4